MLDLLRHFSIEIGSRIKITNRFRFDHSLQITVQGGSPVTISEQLGSHLYVAWAAEENT
jgi:hypothetical protein